MTRIDHGDRDDRETLARFQLALLTILDESPGGEAALEALRRHPDAASFKVYLEQMDPAAVDVAAALVKKWAVRKPPADGKIPETEA